MRRFAPKAHHRFCVRDAIQQNQRAHQVRQRRCRRQTRRLGAQGADEQHIEHSVEHISRHKRHQGRSRLPDAAEHRSLKVVQHDGRNARQVYAQVRQRQREHVIGNLQHRQQRTGEKLAHRRYQHAAHQRSDNRRGRSRLRRFCIPCAYRRGNNHVRAQRNAH